MKKLLIIFLFLIMLVGGVWFWIGASGYKNNSDILKVLSEKNRGWDSSKSILATAIKMQDSIHWELVGSGNKSVNAAILTGESLCNLSSLKYFNLKFIELNNTGITSLDFLEEMPSKKIALCLRANKALKNYDSLLNTKVSYFAIFNSDFDNTRSIPSSVETIVLDNTTVSRLVFNNPLNIKNLALSGNKLLENYSTIKQMNKLRMLSLDYPENTEISPAYPDISDLPELESLEFIGGNLEQFPLLQKQNLTYITLKDMPFLKNLDSLKNKNIKQLILWNINAQAIEKLPSCNIENLLIIHNNLNNIDFISNINGIKKINIRYSKIKTIEIPQIPKNCNIRFDNCQIGNLHELRKVNNHNIMIENCIVTEIK